jgi:hypothetical protein
MTQWEKEKASDKARADASRSYWYTHAPQESHKLLTHFDPDEYRWVCERDEWDYYESLINPGEYVKSKAPNRYYTVPIGAWRPPTRIPDLSEKVSLRELSTVPEENDPVFGSVSDSWVAPHKRKRLVSGTLYDHNGARK